MMQRSAIRARLRPGGGHAAPWLMACLGAVSLAGTSACGREAPPQDAPSVLRIGFGVGGTARNPGLHVLTQLFYTEPLASLSLGGRPEPLLAESWNWEDDGRTLRLRLRQGVTFHDGNPLTADTVRKTLVRAAASSLKSPAARGFEFVHTIETPDAATVVIRLSRPDAFLMGSLSNTTIAADDPDVGTGPYKLLAREPIVRLQRFDGYRRGPSPLEGVEIRTYETPRGAWAAMMRHEVDMVQDVTRDSVQFLEGASDITTYDSLRIYYIPLVFNLRHPDLGHVEVRKALNQAIDRPEIVKGAMRGFGRVADDPIWPFHWTYSSAARRYVHNPEAARLRLDAAGLRVKPAAAGRMASRLRFTCLFWSEDPLYERIALLIQRQLFDVGVEMVLEPMSSRQIEERVGQGDFDAFLFQMASGRGFDWTYAFWHSPEAGGRSLQTSGYTGADAALERLRAARTDAETRSAVADLQQRFFEDPPAAFIAWLETTRAVNSRFSLGDVNPHDLFANIWQWRAAPPRKPGL